MIMDRMPRLVLLLAVIGLGYVCGGCRSSHEYSKVDLYESKVNLVGRNESDFRLLIREGMSSVDFSPLAVKIYYSSNADIKKIGILMEELGYVPLMEIGPVDGMIVSCRRFYSDPVMVCTIYTSDAPVLGWLSVEGIPHGWALGNGLGLLVPRAIRDKFLDHYKKRINREIEGIKGAMINWDDED